MKTLKSWLCVLFGHRWDGELFTYTDRHGFDDSLVTCSRCGTYG